ncbi:MAG: hypothetical protein HYV63_03275 [Candidatus Schekmanbacteria bacterium]|nr:hypothetical protein [Candidatus Schekmanbacteria bacterium]
MTANHFATPATSRMHVRSLADATPGAPARQVAATAAAAARTVTILVLGTVLTLADLVATGLTAAQEGVTLCKHQYLGNPCLTFRPSGTDLDLSNNTWPQGASMNDSISSLSTTPGYEATVCEHAFFQGTCKHYPASPNSFWDYTNNWFNDRISSVEVRKATLIWSDYEELTTYPDERENDWSEEANGITHDSDAWYISNRWHVFKYPVETYLSSNDYTRKADVRDGMQHIGDISYHNGEVFAAVDNWGFEGYSQEARIYVYDRELNFVRYCRLANQRNVPWVTIHPQTGLMYAGEQHSSVVRVYDRSFANGAAIAPLYSIYLDYYFDGWQGTDISENGYLYVSTSQETYKAGTYYDPGVYVFKLAGLTGYLVQYLDPDVEDDPDGYAPWYGMEIEGITLWDLDDGSAPGVTGQIHWIILDNDGNRDDVDLKHSRVDDPSRL